MENPKNVLELPGGVREMERRETRVEALGGRVVPCC